ncbi:hypothetical protein [Streptomyces sp. BK205]|uniref:hypothetical protein n=1 Tax=Streptomyces sp. BK205 TaxID=2512164 RepID=UPI0010521531|nr:hypothetical protein [Streptomyces sp. BK205]TCR16018.1 hypothetical protein EV578_115130 [Streptomyces sp. BK205]
MTPLEWAATTSLGNTAQRRFMDALPYCLGEAESWQCDFADGAPSLRAELADGADTEAVTGRLDRMVHQAAAIPDQKATVIFDGGTATGVSCAPDEQFREVGPGLVVGSPLVATAMDAVDGWALRRPWLAAHPLSVPGMVLLETLERANYIRAFPQHLTGCSVVERRIETLEKVNEGGLEALREVESALAPIAVTPAVCHNVYAYLAGTQHMDDSVYAARGSCARHEPSGYAVGRRMWSFTMREFVFVGSAEGAKRFADTALDQLRESLAWMGLPVRLERANDPFFLPQAAGMTVFQIAADSKFEVVGILPDGSELAIASVNVHRRHFGETFGILDVSGAPVHTACVAFGLERWAYWLLSHLAPDEVEMLSSRLDRGVALHMRENPEDSR